MRTLELKETAKEFYNGIQHKFSHIGNQKARLAEMLAKNISIVLGKDDGYDEAGRQKFKIMPPDEVAERACDIADSFFKEWDKRGWLVEVEPEDKK